MPLSHILNESLSIMDKNMIKWSTKKAPLMTKWSDEVSENNPHPEYPRPQLVRKEWQSLNGIWDLEIRRHDSRYTQKNKETSFNFNKLNFVSCYSGPGGNLMTFL